ncbi:acetate--CoA ligase family protein [Actinokineospora pegani]|uniref:acetate--CoA ligase family protein n=1 Tax=Actinokineospora pegani TaxID=2654637 RepID=UPI0012EA11B7|nr:acetate--CoA ligase family protein [Actinokineospora pegani]
MTVDLGALLAPKSLAVIGASASDAGHAGRCLANLRRTGYAGELHPVNPRHTSLDGLVCHPSIGAVPGPVDAAYVLLPAAKVAAAVDECLDAGVKVITVCTSGFAELGRADEQAALRARVRAAGARMVGPNCIGVLNVVDNVVAVPTFNVTTAFTPGGVTILSQSGGMGVTILNRAQGRGIGVRAMVSTGNEADVEVGELVDALVDDPRTSVVALFVEQLRDGPGFARAAGRARAAGKPVLALKVGRSAAARRSIAGHTGALAGEHRVFADLMRHLGVLLVDTVDELVDTAGLLASGVRPAGNRLGVFSPSGGDNSYAADRAGAVGLELPELPEPARAELAAMLALGVPGNPLDATGKVIGDAALLDDVLGVFAGQEVFDQVLLSIPTWGGRDAEHLLPGMLAAAARVGKPAVVSAWRADDLTEPVRRILRGSSVPSFESVDAAVAALAGAHRYWNELPPGPVELGGPVAAGPTRVLDEAEAKRVLAAAGLPVTREAVVASPDEAVAAAGALGWPVVLKGLAEGVVHKSDRGLVRLGTAGPAEVAAAAVELLAEPDVSRVLVAEQVSGAEVILGALRDPAFGPLVMLGAGGVLTDLLDDVVFLPCPTTPDAVRAALGGLRVGRVLDGARGRVHDTESLVRLAVAFAAWFAADDRVAEVDLNPVIVTPAAGAVIVDAVMITVL